MPDVSALGHIHYLSAAVSLERLQEEANGDLVYTFTTP